jgi:ribosomal protein S18 acetylase RimI-like enzyme
MTAGTAIRRAAPADAFLLSRLGADTFESAFGHLYAPSDLHTFLAEHHSQSVYAELLADPGFAVWIAEDAAGAPLGYAVAGPNSLPVPDAPEDSGELARLYLRREARGRGIGEQLLKAALAFLTERPRRVFLGVYSQNFGAQRLYERHGFVKIGEYRFMVGAHADREWIMELKAA